MNNYKKVILTLLVAILGIGAMNAQFRFGVKAGVNLNSLHISDLKRNFEKDNSCGFTGGVMGELQVPVIGLGFDLSLMYTRMNSDFTSTSNNADGFEENISKNFLEIPLNVKYKIGLPIVDRILTPYIFTGPSFAFRLDKNTLKNVMSQSKCQTAWNVGVGLELFHHLQVQGSYGFAMNSTAMGVINKVVGSNVETETIKAKNNYWTITAAWLF